jgi:DNA-directed RNA polymerase subunit RPC12/RpoP
MPIHKIQVLEYECQHCGYKWINRINGKDGAVPKNCAKCKRRYWKGDDQVYEDTITPAERGLKVRLYKFEGYDAREGFGGSTSYRPNELCKKFLNVDPKPNIHELNHALYPLGWNPHKRRNLIPDPDRPDYLKYDFEGKEYQKLLEEETKKRREFMKRIIKERSKANVTI